MAFFFLLMRRQQSDFGPLNLSTKFTPVYVNDHITQSNLFIGQIKKEFGEPQETITLKRGLGLASNLLSLLLTPWNPASWLSLLGGAGFDVAKDVMSRGPAIEIHKLRSQLPSPAGLRLAVEKLSGR